ncbi:MAG: putative DNA-binding domain-containing protein [Steroidobacterales bacterium]
MPALLELQRALRAQLLDDAAAPGGPPSPEDARSLEQAWLAGDDGALRLAIYRNTCLSTLINALRLSFPAVQRLVGAEFFEASARAFIRRHPPASAYLNDYGADFPGFVRVFPPAAGLAYLGDVAQLEWAVNRALHASDVPGLDLTRLAGLDASALSRVRFSAHPGLSLLRLEFPADAIWRAVLDQNDTAMAGIDLAGGPVQLLIERDAAGVQVRRLNMAAWDFIAQLCAGRPLQAVLDDGAAGEIDAWLAEHLSLGRFTDFHLVAPSGDLR